MTHTDAAALIAAYQAELARLHGDYDFALLDLQYRRGWFSMNEGGRRFPMIRHYRRAEFAAMLARLRASAHGDAS